MHNFVVFGCGLQPPGCRPTLEVGGKVFEKGLKLENRENILIRKCQISNRDGTFGIALTGCKGIRIEECLIRRIGNEAVQETGVRVIKGHEFVPAPLDHLAGISLHNCRNVDIIGNEITDSASKGITITVSAQRMNEPVYALIESNRIGLGLTRLGFARHGMYLSARDAVVEGNTIYNCFYGEGISVLNIGAHSSNKISLPTSDRNRVVVKVSVDVKQFDLDTQGRGTLLASWRLSFPETDRPAQTGESHLNQTGASPPTPQAIATTLSSLTAEFSKELAKAIEASIRSPQK